MLPRKPGYKKTRGHQTLPRVHTLSLPNGIRYNSVNDLPVAVDSRLDLLHRQNIVRQ
jgi:hypothetical protein